MERIVIIGSGMAGYGLLRELRKLDKETPVTVITADDGAAYAKPNLSNALASKKSAESLANQTAEQIATSLNARVLTHTRVTGIDSAIRRVMTDGGDVSYSKLVLALGADPIAHGVTGTASSYIHSVNDLADYACFRDAIEGQKRVAILGGGLIGCEFANDLASAGYQVSVVHRGSQPLERLLPASMGQQLGAALTQAGVAWFYERTATRADSTGEGVALTLDDGKTIEVDVVLSAIGLRPRTALAAAAGANVARGIAVDRHLQTSVPGIYAMGDCVEVNALVLPFVQPLLQQARALAATLVGKPTQLTYPAMPVVVKTPALPVTVAPPAVGAKGEWRIEQVADTTVARCEDATGALLGFALCGTAAGLRTELTKQLPVMLG